MKKKTTLNRIRGSISVIGTPVSILSCAKAPFPVTISPIIEKAMPSWANLPTKSSFALVNPNKGPAVMNTPCQKFETKIEITRTKLDEAE